MGEILLWGAQVIIALFEVWLCYQFLFITVLENDCLDRKERMIECGNIVVVGMMLAANRSILYFSYVAFFICIAVTSICLIWILKREIVLNIGLVTLYFSLVSLLDFLLAFISMVFLQQQFEHKVYLTASFWQVFILIISRLIIFVTFSEAARRKVIEINIRDYKKILSSGSIVFCVILRRYHHFLSKMVEGELEMAGGSTGFSLAVLVAAILFTGMILLKNKEIQKEHAFLISRDEMVEQKYQEMAQLIEKNRELVHDINNHLVILNGYAQEGECEKIRLYIKKISDNLFGEDIEVWSGNKTLDMLLSQKNSVSEKLGIKFDVEIVQFARLPFTDNQICALFGNLLDNALEACERMKGSERWIRIKLERHNRMLFIEISNSIEEKPVRDSVGWVTSKRNDGTHGYGLKSAERVVQEYGGIMSHQVSEHIFSTNLTFFDVDKA